MLAVSWVVLHACQTPPATLCSGPQPFSVHLQHNTHLKEGKELHAGLGNNLSVVMIAVDEGQKALDRGKAKEDDTSIRVQSAAPAFDFSIGQGKFCKFCDNHISLVAGTHLQADEQQLCGHEDNA